MVSRNVLTAVLVVLIVVAGVVGYFAGSSAVPPPKTVTITTTVGVPGTPTTMTTTVTQKFTETVTIAATPGKVYRWRMVSHFSAGDPRYEPVKYFTELVKNMSGGRLIIDLYPAGELFPVPQTLEAVAKGVIEIAEIYTGYWTAQDPVMGLAGCKPGPLKRPHETWYYYFAEEDLIKKHIEAFGVKYIAPLSFGAHEILICRSPVRGLDDLKGKIIRSSGLSAVYYEMLGAKTVQLMAGELYTALQLGTVDCLEWTDYEGDYRLGLHEVAKYVLEAPTNGTTHSEALIDVILIANPKAWSELPDDLKEIVKGAAQATLMWGSYRIWTGADLYGRELWVKAGAQIVTLSPEDTIKAMNTTIKLHIEYAKKSPDAREYVVRLVKIWRDLGYTSWADALEKALKAEGLLS